MTKMNKLKTWCISDSHSYHNLLTVPENVDLVLFSGDESNYKDTLRNYQEFEDFLNWYASLDIKYKVFVAGNHSASIASGLVSSKAFTKRDIIYLENDYVTIEGLKIFGSPLTPTFGDWYFMRDRSKLDKVWKLVDDDVDIMVTHGPPKRILDLSENKNHELEFCGDSSLGKHIRNRIKPLLHTFGHIHDNKDIVNHGIKYQDGIYYSNAAIVEDGKFGELVFNGNLFEIDTVLKKIKIIPE